MLVYQVTSLPGLGIIIRSIYHTKGSKAESKSFILTVLYTYPKVSMTVESLYIRTELGIMSRQLKSLCRPHRL